MRLLAIDFGLKKIGLAFSEGKLAEPLAVVKNQASAVETIAKICREHQIKKIVIGLPEGKTAEQIRPFAQSLSRSTRLPVAYHDETLTTREAIAKMVEAGRGRRYRQDKEDAFAAALILQSYLDRDCYV